MPLVFSACNANAQRITTKKEEDNNPTHPSFSHRVATRKRQTPYPPDAIIRVIDPRNPHRAGSSRYWLYTKLMDGMKVSEAISHHGIPWRMLRRARKVGCISIE
jgi:hypothetical protein